MRCRLRASHRSPEKKGGPVSLGYWPYFLAVCFTIVLVTIPALNRESRKGFDIVDMNDDGVISLMEWELFHPDIDSYSPAMTMFGRLDCDDSQYLSWSEYKDGRLEGDRCLSSSFILSQENESGGDNRLPRSLAVVTERQLESLSADSGFLGDYGAFLESLPDVQQQNDNEIARYEISCVEEEQALAVYYAQLEPGTYPSLTCIITSDVVQAYIVLDVRISVDEPEGQATFFKSLYIDSPETKIHLISDRTRRIQKSDVRIVSL